MLKKILSVALVACCTLGTTAQTLENTPQTRDMLLRFDERFALMDSVIFRNPVRSAQADLSDSAVANVSRFERIDEIDRVVDAQIKAMKSKTGLDVRGQVYVRPGAGLSYDPEDPLVAYNGKIQAELEWNIFHSSLYKRANKIKELQLAGELRQLDYARDDLDEAVLKQQIMIRLRHFGRLLSVLNLHNDNLQLLLETQLYLLDHGKISGDDMLKIINEQTELERQLIAIKADSVVEALFPPSAVAYIELTDTAGIRASIRDNDIELRKLGLRYDLLTIQRSNIDYLQNMDILPFVRFSYYNRQNVHNTHNTDVGISFKIPLTREVSKKRRAIAAEQDVVRYEMQQIEDDVHKDLQIKFHDLEIYNENIKGEHLRMQSLKRFLDMRTHSYGNVDGEYSRINRLQEYNSYLQAWERLLEYVYRRDLILIDIQRRLLTEPVSKYITFKELN
ncbi:MAG: hypothetical protein J1F06_05100 [Prevotellaceae bacterium]|nr:hypothetical protein [Prevotellaceae bacterium]